jgi:hypothetical protein
MLVALILQFSALYFCSSKRGEEKKRKWEKHFFRGQVNSCGSVVPKLLGCYVL